MRTVIAFFTGCLTCAIIGGAALVAAGSSPFPNGLVSSFVKVKPPLQEIRISAQIPDDKNRDFWRQVSIFAEENGFRLSFPPFDRGPDRRVAASLRRNDDINVNVNVNRGTHLADILFYSDGSERSILENYGKMFSAAMGGLNLAFSGPDAAPKETQ